MNRELPDSLVPGDPRDGYPICHATLRKAYPSRIAANHEMMELRRQGREENEAYGPCEYCGRYHLSSNRTGDPRNTPGEYRKQGS